MSSRVASLPFLRVLILEVNSVIAYSAPKVIRLFDERNRVKGFCHKVKVDLVICALFIFSNKTGSRGRVKAI